MNVKQITLGFAGVLLVMLTTSPVTAHDLQTKVRQQPPFVVVEATYDGEEAACFLAVRVLAPEERQPAADAFQTGRTDRDGRFVFLPNRPGLWKVSVDDEMGHRATQEVTVTNAPAPPTSPAEGTGGRTNSDKLLVGLSVLFGVTGLLMAWLSRRSNPRSA
ncbi:MAG: hypothetical protein KIT83_04760 [Bryobacterales bacterium]|nr:hypothetical protein [Bryobacterales bacterium]